VKNQLMSKYIQDSMRIRSCLETLFHENSDVLLSDALERLNRFEFEIKTLKDRSLISVPIVMVAGKKNAGKTTLCRLLTEESGLVLNQGPSGKNMTRKCMWIGSAEHMPTLDSEGEELRSSIEGKTMLGANELEYILVDTPGQDDADPVTKQNHKRILSISGHVILVSDYKSIDTIPILLKNLKGRAILPVVFDPEHSNRSEEGREKIRNNIKLYLKKYADHEGHQPVLFLPQVMPNQHLSDQERDRLKESLKGLLACRAVDPSIVAENLYRLFKQDLRQMLGDFPERAKEPLDEIRRQESRTLRSVAVRILGTDRQVEAGVRLQMLRSVAQDCPVYCFPFRTFLGALGLTAGAWDRIWFTVVGSIPSLASLVMQTGKNLVAQRESRDIRWAGILESAREQVMHEMKGPLNQLSSTIPGKRKIRFESGRFSIIGLEYLRDKAAILMAEAVKCGCFRKHTVHFFGLISTVIWVFLAFGPLYAVYHEFGEAWKISTFDSGSWQLFPVPSLSMIASSLFLIFMPVFLIAMLVLSFSVTHRRVRKKVSSIRSDYNAFLEEAIRDRIICMKCEHPIMDSAIGLLSELELIYQDSHR